MQGQEPAVPHGDGDAMWVLRDAYPRCLWRDRCEALRVSNGSTSVSALYNIKSVKLYIHIMFFLPVWLDTLAEAGGLAENWQMPSQRPQLGWKEGRGLQTAGTRVTLQAGDNLWGPARVTAPPASSAPAPRGPGRGPCSCPAGDAPAGVSDPGAPDSAPMGAAETPGPLPTPRSAPLAGPLPRSVPRPGAAQADPQDVTAGRPGVPRPGVRAAGAALSENGANASRVRPSEPCRGP